MRTDFDEIVNRLNSDIVRAHYDDTSLFEALTLTQSELGLLFGDRTTCPFLRPHMLARSQYSQISYAAETIAEAAERFVSAALQDDMILSLLDLTEREASLARIEPGYSSLCVSSRLDTFIDGDDFKFLEYNAETPAGVGDQHHLESLLFRIPAVKAFLGINEYSRTRPQQKLLESLVRGYREFGGKETKPNIAIVDWDGVSTGAEFESLKDFFESMGFRTLIVDPKDIEYNGRELYAGSFRIDIFYKRIVIHEYLDAFDDGHALIQGYSDGNVFMANSFRVKIAHKKSSFAVLTDEKYASLFTSEQQAIIRKHLPWTRKVTDAATTYFGDSVETLEFIRKNREKMLLKPNDDYGGKGIVMGWEVNAGEWDDAIENALSESFVVQERAAIKKETFPFYDTTARLTDLHVDFDPFLFLNKVEGGMVRLSASSLVNVTQGGGQTALVVLEDF